MNDSFVVTVDLSSLNGHKESERYQMYIDCSKMTIVYEFIEWSRWLFALDNCFYLVNNGTAIHYMEDIRILSKLQFVKLEECNTDCCHTKLHNVLDDTGFYEVVNGVKIPRLIMLQLEAMKQKRHRLSFGEISVNNKSYAEKTFHYSAGSAKRDTSASENKSRENHQYTPNTTEIIKTKYPGKKNDLVYEVAEDKQHYKANTTLTPLDNIQSEQRSGKPVTSNQENLSVRSTLKILHTDKELESRTFENKDAEILSNKKSTFTSRHPKNYVRPFSVGELLNSMRAEACSEVTNNESNLNNEVEKNQFDNEELGDNLDYDHQPKKRKRIRKHKSKKQRSAGDITYESNESMTATPTFQLASPSNFKRKHIRFENVDNYSHWNVLDNSVGADQEMNDCSTPNIMHDKKKDLENGCEEPDIQQLIDSKVNDLKENIPTAMAVSPAKTLSQCQANGSANSYFSNEVVMTSPAIVCPGNEKEFSQQNVNIYSGSSDISELMNLKKKYSAPLVFARF